MAEQPDGPVRPSSGAYVQHLVFRVRDLEKAHDFYTRILGFEQCAAVDSAEEEVEQPLPRCGVVEHVAHERGLRRL